jgi:pyrroloquinoline quinone biosynthesis protein D
MSIDDDSLPRIGHGFRLQWEQVQEAHVLLYPEGMVKLNPSAGQILTRCDGATPVKSIVADLEKCFNTSALSAEVIAFLELAQKQRWVEL